MHCLHEAASTHRPGIGQTNPCVQSSEPLIGCTTYTGLSLGAQHYNGLLLAGCEDWSLVLMRIVWLRAGWGKWLESSVISQETLSQSDTRLLICLGMMYNCAGVLDLIWINVNQLEIWRITVLLCSNIIQYLCFRAYPTTVIPVLSYLETISLVIVAAKWSQDADKGV